MRRTTRATGRPSRLTSVYGSRFAHCTGARILGEATPSYMFVPEIGCDLKRYNPNLKLIVLLRDPVERAISHYYMEKHRGRERRPLWLALLGEPFRLNRCRDGRVRASVTHRCSYRTRGLYSLQLLNLYRFFDRGQVLIVRSSDLLERHDAVLRRGVRLSRCIRACAGSARVCLQGRVRCGEASRRFLVAQAHLYSGVRATSRALGRSFVLSE